jgi:hypothetical protein
MGPDDYPPEWKHPDVWKPSAADPEQEACYTSWTSFMKVQGQENYPITLPLNQVTKSSVLVWETIQSFGINTTYTERCDGIPRLKFLNTSTSTRGSFVTVTVWSDDTDYTYYHDNRSVPLEPNCTRLNPSHCRKISGAGEVGGFLYGNGHPRFLQNYTQVCPMTFRCLPYVAEVMLIYWEDLVATRDICGLGGKGSSQTNPWPANRVSTMKTNAITFRGQDLYLRSIDGVDWKQFPAQNLQSDYINAILPGITQQLEFGNATNYYLRPSVMTGDFTFTSPTVYLALRTIVRNIFAEAENPDMDYAGSTLISTADIIALNKSDVFTLQPINQTMNGLQYAKLVAKGSYHPTLSRFKGAPKYEKRTVDFGNLLNPVPASAYYDARLLDCWGQQAHCGTITDDSYRPILRIAPHVWEKVFGGFMCQDPMLVDPPVSLLPLNEEMPYATWPGQAEANPTPTSTNPRDVEQDGGMPRDKAQPGGQPNQPIAAETGMPTPHGIPFNPFRPENGNGQRPSGFGGYDKIPPLLSDILQIFGLRNSGHRVVGNPSSRGRGDAAGSEGETGLVSASDKIQRPNVYVGKCSRLEAPLFYIFAIFLATA